MDTTPIATPAAFPPLPLSTQDLIESAVRPLAPIATPSTAPPLTPSQAICNLIHAQVAVIAAVGPLHYLEIGVQEGDSMAAALHVTTSRVAGNAVEPAVSLAVGIDTWGQEYGGTARGNANHIERRFAADLGRLLVITGDSRVILPGLRHRFDLIFVDGDHSQEGCLADLGNAERLLNRANPAARILVDDLDHPVHSYLHAAVEAWAAAHGFSFTFHACGYGVAEMALRGDVPAVASSAASPTGTA